MKAKIDFTARLGDERKRKLKRLAKAKNRSMAGQVCQMIDEAEENDGMDAVAHNDSNR